MTFFLARGIPLEDLAGANEYERIMYGVAKEKYWRDESEKYQALFGK